MVETLCEFRRLLLNSWWVCRTRGSLKLGKLGWKVAQPRRISVDDSKGTTSTTPFSLLLSLYL